MYKLGLFVNYKFVTFIGGELPTLSAAIKNLDSLKQFLSNIESESNTAVKFNNNYAIIILDRWNQPIYEAKFQECDSDSVEDLIENNNE